MRLRAELRARVDEVCDERASGGAWFVYLKNGWSLYGEQHCFGEDSFSDVRRTLERVERCHCEACSTNTLWRSL
jgi:hypothetical protein